jgi:ATP-binding cassette subfamily F protein 3
MIRLIDLTLRRGTKVLLNPTNLVLHAGERVGLVGANGAGKSSLFALICGELAADTGSIDYPKHLRIAHVTQETPALAQAALDYVLDGDTHLRALQAELAEAEHANDGHRIAELHTALADANSYDAQSRAEILMLGLGFKMAEITRSVASFSGGWRMRLNLARALLCPSDVLLLDEPTNHLDLEAILWLGEWLGRYQGTVLIISHDRDFLDAAVNRIWHLHNQKIDVYRGDYSDFMTARLERASQQQAAYEQQQRKIAHLTSFIDRFKAQATKARQAQSRIKALEKLERLSAVSEDDAPSFRFLTPDRAPNPLLSLDNADCGYVNAAGDPQVILHKLTLSLQAGQRIALLGSNGAGKSTLIKTLVESQPPLNPMVDTDRKTIRQGKGVVIGYFAQHQIDTLQGEHNPLQHMQQLAPTVREQELRNFLGSFRFNGEMMLQTVASMSGGERARLALAMIAWQKPNLLVLDEPTNHLDLEMRQALAIAIAEFEGAVLLVSHDKALLEATTDTFWLVANGSVTPFEGDLEDYRQWLNAQHKLDLQHQQTLATSSSNTNNTPASNTPTSNADRKEQKRLEAQHRQATAQQRKPLEKKLAACETDMNRLQTAISALEQRLADPDQLASAGAQVAVWMREHGEQRTVLEQLEEQWLEISEALLLLETT